MADPNLFFDGLDTYGSQNAASNSVFNPQYIDQGFRAVAGAFGGSALQVPHSGTFIFPYAGGATVTGGARFYANVSSACGFGVLFTDSSYNIMASGQVIVSPTGCVANGFTGGTFYNPGLSDLTMGGSALGANEAVDNVNVQWFEVEVVYTPSAASGSLDVYLNGTLAFTSTVSDTIGGAGASVAHVGFFLSGPTAIVDDMYVFNNTGSAPYNAPLSVIAGPMGPRANVAPPSSDAATMQWKPSSGTAGYAMVDETAFDGDTTYIEAGTAGLEAQFGISTLSMSNILAVKTGFVGRIDDAGLVEVNGELIVNGTITNGATETLTANYQEFSDLYLTDPTTGAAWDPAKFATAGVIEIGVKRTV